MKQIILWLFSQISNFVSTSMTWKIYGDFSLTHFILGGMFLIALFKLFGFSFENTGNFATTGFNLWKNAENKRDKLNYVNETKQVNYVTTFPNKVVRRSYNSYNKLNTRTGKREKIRPSSSKIVTSHRIKGCE